MNLKKRSIISIWLAIAFCVICDSPGLYANEAVTEKLIANGKPVKLNHQAILGIEQRIDGCFALRSAKPGTVDEFGGHYLSIAVLADVILAPGDFRILLKMGLKKLSRRPGPVSVSLKIGGHWLDLLFEDRRVTVKGVHLDAVRYEEIEMRHRAPIRLDGEPFSLEFERVGGVLSIRLNGRLLQKRWLEPSGGHLAICVERKNLLRNAASTSDTEAELRIFDWTVTAQFEKSTSARQRWEKLSGRYWRLMKRVGNAYRYVKDDPKLPNVLLIGDSISIYYTDPVRRLLAGHADVYRTPMGPGKAETLFVSLDEFLKQGQWDIIHFNSGLHDFARTQGNAQDLKQYRENLRIIIDKLRRTGATLIWANTTPVPKKAVATSDIRCRKYNATAEALMEEEGIPVNDLYSAVLPRHENYWSAPNNIHFNRDGSAFLGRRVANVILPTLGQSRPNRTR